MEIIAYTGEDEYGKFGEIEVFAGTEEQLTLLRQHLIENWRDIGGTEIEIVYRGTDMNAANESIQGLPRVSEEII